MIEFPDKTSCELLMLPRLLAGAACATADAASPLLGRRRSAGARLIRAFPAPLPYLPAIREAFRSPCSPHQSQFAKQALILRAGSTVRKKPEERTVLQPLRMLAKRTQLEVQPGKRPVIAPKLAGARLDLFLARVLRADPARNDASELKWGGSAQIRNLCLPRFREPFSMQGALIPSICNGIFVRRDPSFAPVL